VPWIAPLDARTAKLCPYVRAARHDAVVAREDDPFADMTTSPVAALRRRLPATTPPAIAALLTTEDVREAATHVAAVLALVDAGTIAMPLRHFRPGGDKDATTMRSPAHRVYAALVLRINILESFGAELRAADTHEPVHSMSFYVHAWLDAHALIALALADCTAPPRDDSTLLAAALAAYAPSADTIFHEGELPSFVDALEACSFFGDTSSDEDFSMTALFNKMIPRRCGVRNVIATMETAYVEHDWFAYVVRALLAASLLGVYRHVRVRPALAERLRLYRAFFYAPPPPLAAELARQRALRGVGDVVARDLEMPASLELTNADVADDVEYAGARTAAGLPPAPADDAYRRERLYAFVAARTAASASQQRYLFQNTIVNCVREYMVFVLERCLPHVLEELQARTRWVEWQASVVACMDAMRGREPVATSVLRSLTPSVLPIKTLYQVQLVSFVEALDAALTTFLDTGEPEADGSERLLDAVVTPELEAIVRHLVARYPRGAPLVPTASVPASMSEFERDYVPRGRVPLTVVYATPSVVREYAAVADLYARTPSAAVTTGFARFLADECGMFQFMLVHAFVHAQVNRARVYAFPLVEHLARQQVAVLRERLSFAPELPLPIHLLSSFVCLQCREFRGALVPADAKPTNEMPMSGSELVCFQTDSIERLVASRLRASGLPTYESLVAAAGGGSLFDWYREHATIDAGTDMYPSEPTAFDAAPTATRAAADWLDAVAANAEPFDTTTPLPPVTGGRDDRTPNDERERAHRLVLRVSPLADADAYVDMLRAWEARNGRPFVCGHRSSDPRDESIVWTCASKKYKTEERKTRQTRVAMQKVADSITAEERVAALRSATQRRRHDMRCYYRYSLCSRSQVQAVSMLGYVLRLDSTMIVACCSCLGYTRLDDAHWRADTLLCSRCRRRADAGAPLALGASAASATVKCRVCSAVAKLGDAAPFASVVAFDETTRTFVDVRLCAKHARRKAWLFLAPTYHTLATIDAGLRANWGALRSWDATHDYSASLFHDVSVADDARSLSLARRLLGTEALDDDADDGDDAVVAIDDEPTTTTTTKRRRVAADSRRTTL